MKKRLVIIFSIISVMLLGAFSVNEMMTEPINASLSYSESYKLYSGVTSDTIGVGDSIWEFKIRKKSQYELTPYVYLDIDSVGGTSNSVTITLESKVFEQESYVIRETVTWKLGGDTALTLVSDTAHISEYWKVKMIGADDTFKAKILRLNAKFIQ